MPVAIKALLRQNRSWERAGGIYRRGVREIMFQPTQDLGQHLHIWTLLPSAFANYFLQTSTALPDINIDMISSSHSNNERMLLCRALRLHLVNRNE